MIDVLFYFSSYKYLFCSFCNKFINKMNLKFLFHLYFHASLILFPYSSNLVACDPCTREFHGDTCRLTVAFTLKVFEVSSLKVLLGYASYIAEVGRLRVLIG